MKFVVSKTSTGIDLFNAPCEEAKLDNIIKVDKYYFRTPEEYNKRNGFGNYKKWHEQGENHRTDKDGYIIRDNGLITVWTIELNTLDELIAFYNKYGEIIIQKCWLNESYMQIEIYDDYRE